MSDGLSLRDLNLADALARIAANCLDRVPPGATVAGALVAVTFSTDTGTHTPLSFVTHSQLATPDSVVLRTIAAAILASAAAAEPPPTP